MSFCVNRGRIDRIGPFASEAQIEYPSKLARPETGFKIERRGREYYVHWRIERQQGPNKIVDLGSSGGFGNHADAERWRSKFAAVIIDVPR